MSCLPLGKRKNVRNKGFIVCNNCSTLYHGSADRLPDDPGSTGAGIYRGARAEHGIPELLSTDRQSDSRRDRPL